MGEQVVQRARELAPVRTGNLRAGLGYQVSDRKLTIISAVYYGGFVELGTRNMAARPHIRPALNEASRLILGASLGIAFPGTPRIIRPVLYHRGGYVIPGSLSPRQRKHIATNLLPESRRHFTGNARRAKHIFPR
jgi:hypothetical protein